MSTMSFTHYLVSRLVEGDPNPRRPKEPYLNQVFPNNLRHHYDEKLHYIYISTRSLLAKSSTKISPAKTTIISHHNLNYTYSISWIKVIYSSGFQIPHNKSLQQKFPYNKDIFLISQPTYN